MKEGSLHETNHGTVRIIKYKNSMNVVVKFIDTGYETKVQAIDIRLGMVRDLLARTVYGVGFFGVGDERSSLGSLKSRIYRCWSGMMSRCYSKEYALRYPTYSDCYVCDEWHNFQIFAKWYKENYPLDNSNYHLDKDIKVDGNRVYSPDTCTFVKPSDNVIKAHAKRYKFISPEGVVTAIYNLNEFCKRENLTVSNMCKVNSGTRPHHKGWVKFDE